MCLFPRRIPSSKIVDHKISAYLAVVNTDRQVFQSGCNNYTPTKHALEFHVFHSSAFALCYVLNSVAIVVGV